MIQVTKGMRDFYPEDYRLREWMFDVFRKVSSDCGFDFYDAPLVESEELYIRKAGEEITNQIYSLADKSGRELALRPEMTPSLARMVIQKHKELPGRLKWGTIAQCFRYERMTRGRKREHYQWNLDILGDESMYAEMELISAAIHALQAMGLTSKDVKVRISNRLLLSDLLKGMGVTDEKIMAVFMQIDKLGKVDDKVLIDAIVAEGLAQELVEEIFQIIRCRSIEEVEARIKETNASEEGLSQIKSLFSLLESYGLAEWLCFDFSIVRGLAYYTGTVFEFFDAGKSLRAIAGGGRYDHLIQNLADADLPEKSKGSITKPAVGFGFGDVVILELLKDKKKLPDLSPQTEWYLIPFSEEEIAYLLPLLGTLRSRGISAELHTNPQKPKKMFAAAEKKGAKRAIIAGAQEREEGIIKVKDFATFKEETIKVEDFETLL
jgi:histidyl-tRNA synthetase